MSLGCSVSLRTRTNWYHLMPSSIRRHHWSSASILRASVLDIAQQSEPYRNIGKMHVLLYSFNFVEMASRDLQIRTGLTENNTNHLTAGSGSTTSPRNIVPIYHPHCPRVLHKHSQPSLPVYLYSLILRRTQGKQLKEPTQTRLLLHGSRKTGLNNCKQAQIHANTQTRSRGYV